MKAALNDENAAHPEVAKAFDEKRKSRVVKCTDENGKQKYSKEAAVDVQSLIVRKTKGVLDEKVVTGRFMHIHDIAEERNIQYDDSDEDLVEYITNVLWLVLRRDVEISVCL